MLNPWRWRTQQSCNHSRRAGLRIYPRLRAFCSSFSAHTLLTPILHDVAGPIVVDGPRRREAAIWHDLEYPSYKCAVVAVRIARGLFRLWIIVSVLWIGGVAAVTWWTFPPAELTDEEVGLNTRPTECNNKSNDECDAILTRLGRNPFDALLPVPPPPGTVVTRRSAIICGCNCTGPAAPFAYPWRSVRLGFQRIPIRVISSEAAAHCNSSGMLAAMLGHCEKRRAASAGLFPAPTAGC